MSVYISIFWYAQKSSWTAEGTDQQEQEGADLGTSCTKSFSSGVSLLETIVGSTWGAIRYVCSLYARQFINPEAIPRDWSCSVPWVTRRNKQRCEATAEVAAFVFSLLAGIFYVCIYVYAETHVETHCSQCVDGGPLLYLCTYVPQGIKFLTW